jgi:AmiR/NasT family two-component response regulator
MNFKERVYHILIVSSSDHFASAFTDLLPSSRHPLCRTASSVSAAKRFLAEQNFDFIIINSPVSDDSGIRFAIDICSSRQAVVLLIVKNELHAEIHDKVAEYGVFTLPKPTYKPSLVQAFYWMESARERFRMFEKKTLSLDEKMAEIRLINRAKWILISELKMSEPEAHHYIEKQAMDRCVSKRSIAEDIMKTYS